jgi:hypothetical protein
MRLTIFSLLIGAAAIIPVGAQSVLSVHSGVVHYVEGDAFIGDKAVELKFGQFPNIPEGQNFRTEAGRAEILLTPGSFLRLAENSEIRMVSTHLSDTRIELLKGEIAVESVDSTKDSASAAVKGNSITVLFQSSTTTLLKAGLYDFTADPGRVKVYEGEANVKVATDELLLKKGKETGLNSALLAEKFDPKVGDELIRWSSRRSGYLAMANVNAARSLSNDNSLFNSYLANGYGPGGWAFNPLFGMYSYVPYGGVGFDPFGYSFYSPYSVFYSPYSYFGFPYGYTYGGYPYYPSGYFGGGGSTVASSGGGYQRNPFRSGGIGGGLRNPVISRPTGTTARAAFRTGSGEGGHSSFGGGGGGLSPTTAGNTLSSTSSHASSGGFGSAGGGHASGGGGGHH